MPFPQALACARCFCWCHSTGLHPDLPFLSRGLKRAAWGSASQSCSSPALVGPHAASRSAWRWAKRCWRRACPRPRRAPQVRPGIGPALPCARPFLLRARRCAALGRERLMDRLWLCPHGPHPCCVSAGSYSCACGAPKLAQPILHRPSHLPPPSLAPPPNGAIQN